MREGLRGLTTRGKSFLACAVTVALAALAFGEKDLLRVAVLIGVLPLLASWYVGRTRYKLACTRSLEPTRTPVGATARVVLRLQNLSALPTGTLLLEAAGVGLVTWGGWLGGTLVYRNQIGVDHRYANAGKWIEEPIAPTSTEIDVAAADELDVDQMKLLRVGSKRIVLARVERGYVAFDDRCTHKGGSLADGALVCGTVQCPWHGSQFDVDSGAVKQGPATEKIETYPVEEREGRIWLRVERQELVESR